jgi:hypothetical protein
MRQEIKAKLLKIASVNSKDKSTNLKATTEEMPDADERPSKPSTEDTVSPTDDWSDAESDSAESSSSSGSSASEPSHECRDADLDLSQQDLDAEDYVLEAILNGFGDKEMRNGSWSAEALAARRGDLAKLAFHWTNVEFFAGFRRSDPIPADQLFSRDPAYVEW